MLVPPLPGAIAWGTGSAEERPACPPPLVLAHASILDVAAGTLLPGRTLVLAGGRIAAVLAAGESGLPAGARVVDCTARFVIPGLIDAHVHVAGNPGGSDRRKLAQQRLATALREGLASQLATALAPRFAPYLEATP